MPYARAVTLVEDLPPMVEMENHTSNYELNYKVGAVELDMNEQQPYGLHSINPNSDVKPNPFYKEVMDEYPQIERKIRKDKDLNPYETYLQTSTQTVDNFKKSVDSRESKEPNQQYTHPGHGHYQLRKSPPGSIQQNYVNQDMVPVKEEQHLPVAVKQQAHYNSPLSYSRTYPVIPREVEHFMDKSLSCKEIAEHVNSCPICSILYKKNDKIYMGIIVVLAVLIFLLVWKLNK